ncbi:MAG TPA: hypothetical protein VFH88_11110, partial [Candidatus Krumholzibacteria bacterium]|nr:hypothetical protein [Candidatus Krumholzibacteria bacterium]
GASGCQAKNAEAAMHSECARSMATTAAAGHECNMSTAAKAGCSAGAASAAAGKNCCSTSTASLKGVVDDLPYAENKRVVLAGSYECGHCTLKMTEQCAPMLKTADGKVYPLIKNSKASDLRKVEGKNVKISASVKRVDGVKFLEVKSYTVL